MTSRAAALFAAIFLTPFVLMPSQANNNSEPPPCPPTPPPATRLVVTVEGLRNDSGRILAALYRGSDGFPDDDKKAAVRNDFTIEKGAAIFAFDKLIPGEYAVSLFHDENDNGKMDTGLFGIPKEGFGFSNDPKVKFSAPKFAEASCKIEANETEKKIVVRIKYLSGKGAARP